MLQLFSLFPLQLASIYTLQKKNNGFRSSSLQIVVLVMSRKLSLCTECSWDPCYFFNNPMLHQGFFFFFKLVERQLNPSSFQMDVIRLYYGCFSSSYSSSSHWTGFKTQFCSLLTIRIMDDHKNFQLCEFTPRGPPIFRYLTESVTWRKREGGKSIISISYGDYSG